ncbi:hypothetical protein [Amycolatopsis sp. 195334CR]|uniref:hypothetical protein n=1 Tax=Amycolatopsis sp. 195334CR TaxID=2814588 RepID=UPI001A901BD1|nr:hypothetical protein [Amycolatopsis sp. 195334CR]MBN6035223.1 hypothetical protein [Amycolatopsis sp. 195334CR]
MRKVIQVEDIPMYLRTLAVLAVLLTASVQAPSGWRSTGGPVAVVVVPAQSVGVLGEQSGPEAERTGNPLGRSVAH